MDNRTDEQDRSGGGAPVIHAPTLSADALTALRDGLAALFPGAEWRGGGDTVSRERGGEAAEDALSRWIKGGGGTGGGPGGKLFRGDEADGRVYLWCPWRSGHSSDSGESETSYFPAGGGGFEQGHWKCMHASCTGRTDRDFEIATGWAAVGMEPERPLALQTLGSASDLGHFSSETRADAGLSLLDAEDWVGYPVGSPYPQGVMVQRGRERGTMPGMSRTRNGEVKATIENVVSYLLCDDLIGFQIVKDRFLDTIVRGSGDQWQPFTDADYTTLRIMMAQAMFKPVSRELVRDAVMLVSQDNSIDSAQMWLATKRWDGVPRVTRFMSRYLGTEDSAYARAMGEYIWSGLAGRIIEPGCQLDTVPIWVSAQGTGKSSAVAAMAPHHDHFVEIDMQERETDLARKLRGKVIGELSELRGLHSKEMEAIKAWVTRRYEEFIPKYVEFAVKVPRRLMFIGTTNHEEVLADDTGNRRWAPIHVGETDLAALRRDRDQLWAEGAAMFRGEVPATMPDGYEGVRVHEGNPAARVEGVRWQALRELMGDEHAKFMIRESWEDTIWEWLNTLDGFTNTYPRDADFLQTQKIASEGLRIEARSLKLADGHRIGRAMRALNYKKVERRIDGKMTKVWEKAG